MALPIVAVVGRPNVGKSTLFNKLIGQRLSIVEDTPGVTRDRIYSKCEWRGREFMVVDTGGIEPDTDDVILAQMRRQAEVAIHRADVIVLVTDVRCGVTANDYAVADMLQKSGKPVVLAVNKCDTIGEPPLELYEFYNLGIGEPFPISSQHGHGTGDMLDEILAQLPGEIKQSRAIVESRTEIVGQARREAENVLREAQEKAKQMVTKEAVYAEAKKRSEELIAQTQERINQLRKAANEYMDESLRQTEEVVSKALNEVRDTRMKFRAVTEAQEQRKTANVDIEV